MCKELSALLGANDSNVQDRGGICTPSLQELTKTAHQVDSQVRNISSETIDYTHAGSHGRLGMVDINEASGGEFSTDNGTDPQHHDPNRRIPAWLGAVCQGEKTGSHWSTEEQEAHINVLELKAEHLAIQSYLKKDVLCQLPGKRLLLQMDNTTAVPYINKRGGTKSDQLTYLALEIWKLCQSHKISVVAQYLPGLENVEADAESRQMNARIEWTLAKHLFVKIQTRYYIPKVDLFAFRLNHQVPMYVARRSDPGAMAIDAFTLDWSKWTSFIHPPIVLLNRVLLKIRQDRATALLVAPAWVGQPWYRHCWTCWSTFQPNFRYHRRQYLPSVRPDSGSLIVEDVSSDCMASFRRRMQTTGICATSSWHLEEQVLQKDTQAHGKFGLAGVVKGKNVSFQQL